ncbi:PEPxxWA-CTERM sorting domain-containing protein [Sphingosinicellaceae bacterium]|nr:PEPxxWA-CTERM sorting domain-containing protein [Sphingosinicellaceae bacterium]
MKLKSLFIAATIAVAAASTAQAATYTYVGSWSVSDGPNWQTNPAVYTGQEAAALLFGGTASSYAISTLGPDTSAINFQAHVDGWADSQYLSSTVSQSYSLDTGGSGYNSNPGTGSAYSAYVQDHGAPGEGVNYAFRLSGAVPEPASWALMIAGFGFVGVAMRRREIAVAN